MATLQELELTIKKMAGVIKSQGERIRALENKVGNVHLIVGTTPPEDVLTDDKDNGTIYFHCDTEVEET